MTDIDFIPTDPRAIENELLHVRALMQLEQKEDQAQFKLRNASASIKERRRRGFTWYPITITKEELPDWVYDSGKLGIDLTFDEVSYREMNNALSEVMGAYGNRLAELRDVLLGNKSWVLVRRGFTKADWSRTKVCVTPAWMLTIHVSSPIYPWSFSIQPVATFLK